MNSFGIPPKAMKAVLKFGADWTADTPISIQVLDECVMDSEHPVYQFTIHYEDGDRHSENCVKCEICQKYICMGCIEDKDICYTKHIDNPRPNLFYCKKCWNKAQTQT